MTGGRMTAAVLIAGTVLLTASACATTEQVSTAPTSSASSTASTSPSVKQAEAGAVAQLQSWLINPQAGNLTYNAVQVTAGGSLNVMSILSGPFDPALGQARLSGSVQTIGSGSSSSDSTAVESGGRLYSSIPQAMQTGSALGMQWDSESVNGTWGKDPTHSGWWMVLDAVQSATSAGLTSLDGTNAYLYVDTVDLTQIPGLPKQLLDSDPVRKAGVSKVEVDIYLQAGTGMLQRVTYKLGLPVQIDAAATAKSSAGFQVDMSGFASTTATPTATPQATPTVPDPTTVAAGTGDEDLAALLPF